VTVYFVYDCDRYYNELFRLERIRSQYIQRLMSIQNEQSVFQHVTEETKEKLIIYVNNHFVEAKQTLKDYITSALIAHSKKNKRFSLTATNTLEAWFTAHMANPYPSMEEKTDLAKKCSLTLKQVNVRRSAFVLFFARHVIVF